MIVADKKNSIAIEGLLFVLTCEAFPEQYDVWKGKKIVGYVRARWGQLRVDCPSCGGDIVYEERLADPLQGSLDDKGPIFFYEDEEVYGWKDGLQRLERLGAIAKVIKEYMRKT